MKNELSTHKLLVRGGLLAMALVAIMFLTTSVSAEEPFGGQVEQISGCIRETGSLGTNRVYVKLGDPRGGSFIWTEQTDTYLNGPPNRVGQWLLGLAGAPYVCVVSVNPLNIKGGLYMVMVGSSL